MADIYYTSPVPPFHTAVGAAFTTFTAFQDVSPVPRPLLFGGQLRAGSVIELEAEGEFSTTGTPTFSRGFYYRAVGVLRVHRRPRPHSGRGMTCPSRQRSDLPGRRRPVGHVLRIEQREGQQLHRAPTQLR